MFRLEINDPTEAEALISQKLSLSSNRHLVEEFRTPISVHQCHNCQSFGHLAKTCRPKPKCLLCGENHSHKRCPNREARKPKCANCKGPRSHMLHLTKGVQNTKNQTFRQHLGKPNLTLFQTINNLSDSVMFV